MAGHHVLHGRSGAAVGHDLETGRGRCLEIEAGELRRGAGNALRGPVRVCLQPRDQFLQVCGRHGLPADDQQRADRQQADRLEVVEHVVLERADGAIDHVRADVT